MPDVSLSGIEFEIKGSSDAASDSIKKLISSLGSLKKSLESSAKVSTLTKSLGYMRRDVEKTSSALSKIGGLVKSLGGKMGKILSGGTKGFLGLLSFPLKGAVKNVGAFAKSLGDVGNKFKRILGYRIIRSLIKEIEQAFGEGIKNLYGWSKAMGGATISGKNFAQTMDGLATSSLYFKNSIGAAVAPLISALAPAIDYIIDKIVALINVINQLFALLGGATSWNKAIRKATEFEDAAGGAGGAAKEALRYLAPFDELNRLPDDNKGGGGGGSGDDYSGMFEEQTEFLEGLKDFADSVRAAIDAGDWEGLGVLLGDKVNELIEKIDFEAIGSKVGESINALFTTRYWTLKEINFQNIGAKIAEFLNSALGNIDFETVGRSFTQKFTLLPDVIIGFLGEADWKLIGKSVGDYLRGVFEEGAEWLGSINWEEVGTEIVNGVKDFFVGLDISTVASAIGDFLIAAFDAAAGLLKGSLSTIFSEEFWEEAKTEITVNGKSYELDPVESFMHDMLGFPTDQEIIAWATPYFKSAGEWILQGLKDTLDEISYMFTGMSAEEFGKWIENGSVLLEGWLADLPAKAKNAGIQFINSLLQPIVDGINDLIEQLPDDIKEFLGIDGPISFQLIPEIPESELTKHYNEAKQTIEDAAKQDPPKVAVGMIPAPDENGDIFSIEDLLGGKDSIEIPVTIPPPDENGPVFTAEDLLGGKDSIELPATADFKDWSVYGTKNAETVKSFTTWDSTANWKDWKVYGSKSSSSVNAFTTWSSTANWNKQTIGKSWGGTTWNSTANFTKYTIKPSLQAADGSLKVNGTFNIVQLTGNKNIDQVKAGGGVYTSGGWKPVQSFAGGGSPFGGQIFRARENGNPELVGTLRGSTAVMNNDQIVASVSSGVARAIAGIRFQMTGLSASAPAMEESANEDTMYRAFRRALDETDFGKDISIDGEPIYQSVVRRNRQNTRATGVNQLAMA